VILASFLMEYLSRMILQHYIVKHTCKVFGCFNGRTTTEE